jgi:two-component system nitrate/nitrite response regulator NarL
MQTAPIALIDSNNLLRQGLKGLLVEGGLEVVREWGSPREAASIAGSMPAVSLVLCDPPPEAAMYDTVTEVRSMFPEAQVVILTSTLDPPALVSAFRAGADGYLLKDITPAALVQSLRLVLLGEKVFPTELAEALIRDQPDGTSTGGTWRDPSPPLGGRAQHPLIGAGNSAAGNSGADRPRSMAATVVAQLKTLVRKLRPSNHLQASAIRPLEGAG